MTSEQQHEQPSQAPPLVRPIRPARPPPVGRKSGRLTVVGSGIGSVGQFTLESVAYIEQADKVFYVVADPVTEAFIHSKNPSSVDLYRFYDNKKPRMSTYIQMAEVSSVNHPRVIEHRAHLFAIPSSCSKMCAKAITLLVLCTVIQEYLSLHRIAL